MDNAAPGLLHVEVACADAGDVILFPVEIAEGATVRDAIEKSGVRQKLHDIDSGINKTGIYGELCGMDTPLKDGDRVEIYRPLIADPKEARRRRASLQKEHKAK